MKQLSPFTELGEIEGISPEVEFEAQILEKNGKFADLLIKKGYKIKKPVWNRLIAS